MEVEESGRMVRGHSSHKGIRGRARPSKGHLITGELQRGVTHAKGGKTRGARAEKQYKEPGCYTDFTAGEYSISISEFRGGRLSGDKGKGGSSKRRR